MDQGMQTMPCLDAPQQGIGVFEHPEAALTQQLQCASRIESAQFIVGMHMNRYAIGACRTRDILMNEDARVRAERCSIGPRDLR